MRILLLILFFAVSLQAQPLKERIMAIQSHDDLETFIDEHREITAETLKPHFEGEASSKGLRLENGNIFVEGAYHPELLSVIAIFRLTIGFEGDSGSAKTELLKRGFLKADLRVLDEVNDLDNRQLFSRTFRKAFKRELNKRSIYDFEVGLIDYRVFFSSETGQKCLQDRKWIINFMEAESVAAYEASKLVSLTLMYYFDIQSVKALLMYGYEVVALHTETSYGDGEIRDSDIEYFRKIGATF